MIEGDLPRNPGEIIYHFDVSLGSIPLGHFIDTARATQEIIDDFIKSFFDEKLRYELRVKTPEVGSLTESELRALLPVIHIVEPDVPDLFDAHRCSDKTDSKRDN